MYLKALEIQGFKSFPEKTRLTFEKDITAIVGPNGSGKSNISDAIRWVMGEQSTKTLRGGKMEDVIFGGTQQRSQVGFAQVSLVLDNSAGLFPVDASEVMLTRRYYRSGESEYYINRESVRLRDIHEVLMDTGLGRDGYSNIGQGRIDEILSAKSTDRREIFEEAAGISKYRSRKEESERKLERTEENLVRINDKIAELELQVEPLGKQAEVAKRYLLLRDEMRSLEISTWMENLDRLSVQSVRLAEDYAASKQQLAEAQQTLDDLYQGIEAISEKMRDKDLESETVRSTISELEARRAELESAGKVLKTNIQNNVDQIHQLRQEIQQQSNRETDISAQIQAHQQRSEEIAGAKADLTAQVEQLLAQMEAFTRSAGEKGEQLAALLRDEADLLQEVHEKQAQRSALASAAGEMRSRKESIGSDLEKASATAAALKSEGQALAKALAEAEEQKTSAQNVIRGYAMQLELRTKKVEGLQAEQVKQNMEKNALESRAKLLADMEKEYEGFSKAVKIVMQEAGRGDLRGIHGTVASLITTEDTYTLAIETALGAAIQNIVVDTEESGKAAISLLRRRDGGRATFLPISTIRGSNLREDPSREAGFKGVAADLVRCDGKYKNILSSLLGRTVIVGDMDDAISISRKYGNRFRIVTLDGQVINAGGSMTGGSPGRNVGILSRANERKRIEAQLKKLAEQLLDLEQKQTEAQRELDAAKYAWEVEQNTLRQAEDQLLSLGGQQENHRRLEETAEAALTSLEQEAAALDGRLEENRKAVAALDAAIAGQQQAAADLRSQADALSQGQEALAKQREQVTEKMAALREEAASLTAEQEAGAQSIAQLTALMEGLAGDNRDRQSRIQALTAQNEDWTAAAEQKDHLAADVCSQIQAQQERLGQISAQKLDLERERTLKDKASQEQNKEILNLERESAKLEQKKLSADLEEKQIVDKLWDTYELSRTAAQAQRQELESYPKAMRRIGELKKEIASLGTPNLGAIDEYERVNARYTYLTEQRDDVTRAKGELEKIIGNITKEMTEIFGREFKLIDESFRTTFQELFGGGRASLELEDENDILNCGIEIHVQPPGKTLKTLTLLSGGEKAFVAIALYFAILKVRPTPFCVMDEIEAALDEANVVRFAKYLRKLSDKTQFIVITHRRGTMEEADLLYGVTMQEMGVSKVLHIDLDEAEKQLAR